jgi:hypothetical protein
MANFSTFQDEIFIPLIYRVSAREPTPLGPSATGPYSFREGSARSPIHAKSPDERTLAKPAPFP